MFLFVFVAVVFLNFGHVSADNSHKVLLLGDSLTLAGWADHVFYDHTVVAKRSQNTNWILEQLNVLIASGEIDEFDSAVVWIGVNNPYLAVEGIPEIYGILHSHGIKVIGVTQYLHRYGKPPDDVLRKILEYNEIVRAQADAVVDLAVNPAIVDSNGFVRLEVAPDGLHPSSTMVAKMIASDVNGVLDALYGTPAPIPTGHKAVIFGDSQTFLYDWPDSVVYDHTVVAKGGITTKWVLEQLERLVASGEISQFDSAVVWIGVNNPIRAQTEIPEIYAILHGRGLKVVGITQYLHWCEVGKDTLGDIRIFNEIVRAQADLVLDFATDPAFVNGQGFIRPEVAADCLHFGKAAMSEYISSAVNGALDTLYSASIPTSTPEPTITPTLEPTSIPTSTHTPEPTISSTSVPTIMVQQEPPVFEVPESGINISVLMVKALTVIVFGFFLLWVFWRPKAKKSNKKR